MQEKGQDSCEPDAASEELYQWLHMASPDCAGGGLHIVQCEVLTDPFKVACEERITSEL